ncbi:MAG: sensor histidine kinase [Flavobacteriales bacterium]|nr:sensor histidine kinase [Flavobacteriales bacterium]
MKCRIISFFFIGILLLVGVNGISQDYAKLSSLSKEKPDSVLTLLKTRSFNLDKYEFVYLKAKSQQLVGKYDSSILVINRYLLESMDSPLDSARYIELSVINAENYRVIEEYDLALPPLLMSLQYNLDKKDTNSLIKDYTRLTEFYRSIEKMDVALDYANSGLQLALTQKNQNLESIAHILNRKAAIFTQIGIYIDSAISISLNVINLAKKHGYKNLEASSCNEVGFLYYNLGRDSVLYYYDRSIQLYEELNNYRYKVAVKINKAKHYTKIKEFEKAQAILDNVLAVSIQYGYSFITAQTYEEKGQIFLDQGDIKSSDENTQKAWQLYKEIEKSKGLVRVSEAETRFEWDKVNRQIQEKQAQIEEALSMAELEKIKRHQTYWLIFILVLTLSVVAYFLVRLTKANTIQRESSSLLLMSNNQLASLIEQKEILLQEVNHRVKNNLSVLNGLLYLQQRSLKNENAISALKGARNRIAAIGIIHEKLYQQQDIGEIKFQYYLIKLCQFIRESFGIGERELKFEIRVEDLNPTLEKSVPLAMLINELVTNSCKHAFKSTENPFIGIKYYPEEMILTVYDNGTGEISTKEGSIGLKLIHILAEQIEGSISTTRTDNYLINTLRFTKSPNANV